MTEPMLRTIPPKLPVRFPYTESVPGANPELALAGLEHAMHFVSRNAYFQIEVFESFNDGQRQLIIYKRGGA